MICKNCGNNFPNRILVDGKYSNLQKRKYCLDCSPHKKHNTRILEVVNAKLGINNECVCERCGKEYIYERNKGLSTSKCASCHTLTRREKIKVILLDMKGGKCEKCGYNTCSSALAFHHRIPSEKSFSIGQSYNLSLDKLKKEVEKCALLCHNCHSELHEGIWNFGGFV